MEQGPIKYTRAQDELKKLERLERQADKVIKRGTRFGTWKPGLGKPKYECDQPKPPP